MIFCTEGKDRVKSPQGDSIPLRHRVNKSELSVRGIVPVLERKAAKNPR